MDLFYTFKINSSYVHFIIQDIPEFLGQTGRKINCTQRNNFGTAMWRNEEFWRKTRNAKEMKMSI